MKFFRIIAFCLILIGIYSCKKENKNIWDIEIKKPISKVDVVDISKEFYNQNIDIQNFKQKFPWFQGTVSDADYELRRKDAGEIKIYKEAIQKIDLAKLNSDFADLFAHIKYYYPSFQNPKIFLYSSVLQSAKDPIFFRVQDNMLFIDVTGFMGENNPNYDGIERYFQKSMNPQNIVPKVSQILAENMVPVNQNHQKFLDELVYQGKIMTMQDAFLPKYPDFLKINYTPRQYDWCLANEANIWNYFVENNLVFSDDQRLSERFISPGPFSKFYTEVDNESSPQVGIFSGWRICQKFFEEKPETKLQNFLKMNATDIFNSSNYKPKN